MIYDNINTGETYSAQQDQEEKSTFNFKTVYLILLLNWKWFLLSIAICVGFSMVKLRYETPVYQAAAKLLIKEENGSRSGRNSITSSSSLGTISNTIGINNEMEILKSLDLAQQTVKDLKLYVSYMGEGRIKDYHMYKNEPISVDIDPAHLETLKSPISLVITRKDSVYTITGTYYYEPADDPGSGKEYAINHTITLFPTSLSTKAGTLTFNMNRLTPLAEGKKLKVTIKSPKSAAYKYAGSLSVGQTEGTTIARLILSDEIPQRAIDYLRQLIVCYNRQANDDKNAMAQRTESFINSRLEKINSELGDDERQLEQYKKSNNMVALSINASQAASNQNEYSQRLVEANTQLDLLNTIYEYMDDPENKYQALPSNVVLSDQTASQLISKYNEVVLQRNSLLRSASESSPIVTPLTAQLDDLTNNIRRALSQARRTMEIQRNSISQQYSKYTGQITSTPEQERILSQIGRQQTIKEGIYLTLLEKREENSISLAATADKGKLIDDPQFAGQISPKSSQILLMAFLIGLAIPAVVFFLMRLLRYKVEGHDDVASLTSIPIIADVPTANDIAKTRADIVVHENQNSQMDEVFRSMRTNVQFMFKDGHKTAMFTSYEAGAGKTFCATNLAMSFALLEKRVILVGLDIRKPRLAELFEINDHHHGITRLLTKDNPTEEEIKAEIIPSGINKRLDLLTSGPIPPNPTELLSRKSLQTVIDTLKKNYDYVLIDTAPIGLVIDTIQVGYIADITIYVCRADHTPRSSFSMVNSLNKDKKLPGMCIAINGINMAKKKYGYYYGNGPYSSYGVYYGYRPDKQHDKTSEDNSVKK